MKKILRPGVKEAYELICDVTGKPAVARLFMSFGYGSKRDLDILDVNLSDEVAEDVLHCSKAITRSFRRRRPSLALAVLFASDDPITAVYQL